MVATRVPTRTIAETIAAGNPGHRTSADLTPLAVIEGTFDAIPDPPADLEAHGRAIWDRVTPIMKAWVGTMDYELLARYCQTADLREIVRSKIRTPSARGSRGQLKTNPLIEQLGRLDDRLLRMEHELGLTPAGRRSLRIETRKPAQARKLDKYVTKTG